MPSNTHPTHPPAAPRPYRSGWLIVDAPGGRYATRNERTLHQGNMNYHQFIAALDRIAGFVCWEDIMAGLRKGLSVEASHAQAVFTEDEAWAMAEALARGAAPATPTPQQPKTAIQAPQAPGEPQQAPAPPPPKAPVAPQGTALQQSLFDPEDN